jgi:hypothetical protein
MSVNNYWQGGIPQNYSGTQNMIDRLTIQAIKISGMNVYYITRTVNAGDIDPILIEDVIASYENAYQIEMYLENATGFGGEGALLSKFGIELQDSCTFVVSRTRWQEVVQAGGKTQLNLPRPVEGDLIYLPLTKSFFEIKRVDAMNPFFQLGKLFTYSLECELYNPSHQEFDTGISEIDELMAEVDPDTPDPDSSQNVVFDNEGSSVINWSESNPFNE